MLLGKNRSDEADDRGPFGKMPTTSVHRLRERLDAVQATRPTP
jgi:hypothetical protein